MPFFFLSLSLSLQILCYILPTFLANHLYKYPTYIVMLDISHTTKNINAYCVPTYLLMANSLLHNTFSSNPPTVKKKVKNLNSIH